MKEDEKNSHINLILVGFGKVGQELVQMVAPQRKQITGSNRLVYSWRALVDSRGILENSAGISTSQIQRALAIKMSGGSIAEIPGSLPIDQLTSMLAPGVILIDTSASTKTLPLLLQAIDKGGSIVLANKHPLCLPAVEVNNLYHHPRVHYESTVGAGLPIISALRDLRAAGDRIISIEACLSGTLGYLCSCLQSTMSYSAAVLQAYHAGYTEPDPRQDLSGMDVARKAVILGRTAGFDLALNDMAPQSLYDRALDGLPVDAFFLRLPEWDSKIRSMQERAAKNGEVLRYIAKISSSGVKIGLDAVPQQSSLGLLKGPENQIAVRTMCYENYPLVISGPGAGVSVTAGRVLSDIYHLVNQMV